jgi:hypothetical protein
MVGQSAGGTTLPSPDAKVLRAQSERLAEPAFEAVGRFVVLMVGQSAGGTNPPTTSCIKTKTPTKWWSQKKWGFLELETPRKTEITIERKEKLVIGRKKRKVSDWRFSPDNVEVSSQS